MNFALGRVGRFPPQGQGGASWYGVLADSNQVDADHWFADIIADPPEGWEVFVQPGGVVWDGERWVDNPEGENRKYLPEGYYTNQMGGQSQDFIKVYLGNLPGYVQDGRAVFPEFNDALHVASEPFGPIEDLRFSASGLSAQRSPPITHHMVLPLDDETVIDLEVLFVALDNPDGQAALKGFEPTGIFFNELAEIPRGIVNFALGRVGRFPPQAQGGPSWYGVIGDSNQVAGVKPKSKPTYNGKSLIGPNGSEATCSASLNSGYTARPSCT